MTGPTALNADELPTPHCWRCNAPCNVDWVDVSTLGDPEPRVIQGETRCTNARCLGYYDWCAHMPPSPETLARRGEEALQRVRDIATGRA